MVNSILFCGDYILWTKKCVNNNTLGYYCPGEAYFDRASIILVPKKDLHKLRIDDLLYTRLFVIRL